MKTEKRTLPAILRALLCALAMLPPLAGCNILGSPDYELTVTVEAGVTGTPASGVYVYPELEKVEYQYTPVNSLHTVEVLVDNGRQDAEDSITIYHSTALVARLFDLRGTWTVTSYTTESTISNDFDITFSGADLLGGTFSDSRSHHGTWDASGSTFHFNYSDLESFKFTGTLPDMSGTWSNGTATGSWNASRKD